MAVALLAAGIGCDDGPSIVSSEPTFDIDLFEQNVRDALDGQTVGYAYAISQDKQLARSGANGFALARPWTARWLRPLTAG